jgi:hypothetical protein
MPVLAAEFFIQPLVIDDIVSMHAARSRLKIGRAIQMRDAQRLQVFRYPGRVVKCETAVQLKTVCGCGYPSHTIPCASLNRWHERLCLLGIKYFDNGCQAPKYRQIVSFR